MREARENAGLTQRDLAVRLKRDRSYVWKSEKGERRMDAVDLIRWCAACDSDPVTLFKKLVDRER